ncbi:MAG TPA: GNAT family protein [Verrucomicrobiae bacterium]|jgi:RimJ/RimL family protein N-acetyltransferase|nr:GNAT family protein [Verrucomicrobiae bacterium]
MKIRLARAALKDFPNYQKWFRNPKNRQWLGTPFCELDYNIAFHAAWIRKNDSVVYTIYEGRTPIGCASALAVDRKNKNANIILVLGDKKFRGRGIAAKAGNLFLRKMFFRHGLRSVYAWAVETNAASVRIIERNNFTRVGIQRRSHKINGVYKNRILFDLLKEEFIEL